MKLSVIIPAHNEASCIHGTVTGLYQALVEARIDHEIIVVNDNSSDGTPEVIREMTGSIPSLRMVNNDPPHGFGFAVRRGLDNFHGDCVALYMADASDSPRDLVWFFHTMVDRQVDCVFGTRWHPRATVTDYPKIKWALNRLANLFIQVLFGLGYNDMTNAFKLYHRRAIQGLRPFLSHHFNLTVELPLKAIIRGFSYEVVPNDWANRKTGLAKLKIQEMGSRYLFIVLYCWIEKWLSAGDYHSKKHPRLKKTS